MRKYKKRSSKKNYKPVVYILMVAALGFFFNKSSLLGKVFLMDVLPNYSLFGSEKAFLKPKEENPETTVRGSDVFDVENEVDIYNDQMIGLYNVIYQDEDEFRPLVGDNFKENITQSDIDLLRDTDYLLKSFYNKDKSAGIIKNKFDVDKLLSIDLYEEKKGSEPQVLIFHTHAGTEFFLDSNTDDLSEGVVGAGEKLQYILKNKYGIQSIHHKGVYDVIGGRGSRNGSYERMEVEIQKILDENPSIVLAIDLHRDGIEPDPKFVNYIDGKPYAKMMFVNGVSAVDDGGVISEIESLKNPNLDTNLALSFNMQLAANELYPNSTRKILLKAYRYSTYMLPKSLLVELGCQYNTKEEAFNSMEILADLIENVVFSK